MSSLAELYQTAEGGYQQLVCICICAGGDDGTKITHSMFCGKNGPAAVGCMHLTLSHVRPGVMSANSCLI